MADLGNRFCVEVPNGFARNNHHSYAGYDARTVPATNSTITGEVTVNGSAIPGSEVYLFWRPSMQMVAKTVTGPNGTYTFSNLLAGTTNYVVYIKDVTGGTAFNDIVYALVDTTV